MGALSIWHWLIVLAVVLVLFGGGSRLSAMMGDVGKGLRVFKRNLQDDNSDVSASSVSDKDENSGKIASAAEGRPKDAA